MNTALRAAAQATLLLGLIAAGPSAAFSQTAPTAPNATPQSPATPAPASAPQASPSAQPTGTPQATPTPKPAAKKLPKPLAAEPAVDSLSPGDLQQAISLLRANCIDNAAVSDEGLNRATLQGLLERLGPGAAILEPAAMEEGSHPFRSEILDDRIGYVRIGSLSADHLGEFDAALGNFAAKKLEGLIVDLRDTPSSNDFDLAAEFIKRLTPKGKMLFAVHRPSAKQERMFTSSRDPSFDGVVVTVVDHETSGAGEVVAAVLRSVRNALAVGQTTAGKAAGFSDLPLRGGKLLRVAVAEVKLPGGLSIFPGGFKPDLPVAVSPEREAEALRAGLEKGVSGLVFETERAKLNEAALVAGVNPEIDAAEAAQRNGGSRRKSHLADPALRRAVDLITTIDIFSRKPGGK